jgi:hypothetical protein
MHSPTMLDQELCMFLKLETWVVRVHKITVEPHHILIDNVVNHFCSCDKEFATFEPLDTCKT